MFSPKINWMIVWCFFCLAFNAQTQTDVDLQYLESQIAKNPDQELELVQQYWLGKQINVDNITAGLRMITVWIKNQQLDKATDLLEAFSVLPNLTVSNEALILAQKLHIARALKNQDQDTSLIKAADDLLGQMRSLDDQTDVINAQYALNRSVGYKYYFSGSFASAEPYLMEALQLLAEDKYKTKSDLLNIIGVVKAQQADLVGAAEYMLKSIQILEQQNLPVKVQSYQNLGSLNFMLKEWDKTIEYSEQALTLQGITPKLTASLLSNMAAAYVEKGELNLAIDKLNQSIEISEKIGTSTSSARNNLGYIYNQVGEYNKALEQLQISKTELIKAGADAELSVTYKSMADVYANRQQYDQAAELYEQAYQLHLEKDFKMKRVELYPKWIDVLVKAEDYKKAYQLMVEFKALNDEIIDVESTKKVNEVMAAFEVDKSKQALVDSELIRKQQQNSIELLNNRNELEERIRTSMIIMVSALVLLLFFIIRSWRFRGQVNQVLMDKNKHIENQQNQLLTLNTQLKSQAEVDSLTGIHNRRYITNYLNQMITDMDKANSHWCLIMIDIDDFKAINDTYGHQRGDEVLQQFAECLDWVRSPDDVIARWGGEEFLWLVNIPNEHQGEAVAVKNCAALKTALADLTWFRGNEDTVTCSMGYVMYPLIALSFEDWEAALKLADHALYQAKNSGKNNWRGLNLVDDDLNYSEFKDVDGLIESQQLVWLE